VAGTREQLHDLLDELLERPYDRAEIERRIEETFVEQRAVMVLDMSGFSRTTQAHGIVSCLLMIHQMRLLAQGPVEQQGGTLVKAEADNLFALFPTVDAAVAASRRITGSLAAANLVLPKELELYVAIGIGFGGILNVGDEDLWGTEVNVASRLGEDVAQLGDILLTQAARAQLTDDTVHVAECAVQISGLPLTYFAVRD
jgi:class 3 adenylate cyclase